MAIERSKVRGLAERLMRLREPALLNLHTRIGDLRQLNVDSEDPATLKVISLFKRDYNAGVEAMTDLICAWLEKEGSR
jgi:hypothetical protein